MTAHAADSIEGARLLVVINPEDREQVESLFRLALKTLPKIGPTHRDYCDALQAALREFADPKPAEPTGLGAVVEDIAGELWVRFSSKNGFWWRCHQGANSRWDNIDAVKVLSEGVTS